MICRICNEDRKENLFRKYTNKKSGITYQRKECKYCLSKLCTERRLKKKLELTSNQ
jgi:hypothetical protein